MWHLDSVREIRLTQTERERQRQRRSRVISATKPDQDILIFLDILVKLDAPLAH